MRNLTHFNEQGRAYMVDVTEKNPTVRTAVATGAIYMDASTLAKICAGKMKKGDVLAVAQIAGIMAAKQNSNLIPMCHPICLTSVNVSFFTNEVKNCILIRSEVRCKGETGVEMEALTAVSVAALTIYDMCKAVQKNMHIEEIKLIKKAGGKSGIYCVNSNISTDPSSESQQLNAFVQSQENHPY